MSILITGGLGFLGANLCYEFLKQNRRKVIAYDVVYRIPNFLREFTDTDNFVFVRGDIEDQWNLLETVKKYDVTDIIHAATLNTDKASIQRPYQFLRTNILGAVNLLELARHQNIRRLISISSRAAYGAYAPEEGPLRETFPFRPVGFYGASKACVDIILPLYRTHYQVDAVSIRPTAIFGPGQGEAEAGYTGITSPIYNILTCVLKGRPFSLPSGGDHHIEVTYVKELVRGIRLILEAKQVKYPIYTVSYGKQFKISEIGDMIKELLPKSEIHIGSGLLEGIELRAAMDNSRAREEFGYEHSPLRECIKDFIKYLTL